MNIIFTAFIFLLIALWLRHLLIIAIITSESMSPTLKIGDRVLAIRYWPTKWLRKGQIVLLWPPSDYVLFQSQEYDNIPIIKRIIGLPGDTIEHVQISKIDNTLKITTGIVKSGHFVVKGDLITKTTESLAKKEIPIKNFYARVLIRLQPLQTNLEDSH